MDSDPRPFIGDPFQDPAAAYLLVEAKAPARGWSRSEGREGIRQASSGASLRSEVVYPAA